jgi:hypothetical protein
MECESLTLSILRVLIAPIAAFLPLLTTHHYVTTIIVVLAMSNSFLGRRQAVRRPLEGWSVAGRGLGTSTP